MRKYILILFLFPTALFCQMDSSYKIDTRKNEIENNIYRIGMTTPLLPLSNGFLFTGFYECNIKAPFTLVIKAGPSLMFNFLASSSLGTEYDWSVNAIAASDFRYYFNLKRRIRKQKTTRNFSAAYLSVEPYILSNAIVAVNKPKRNAAGHTGVFANIGFQKQYNKYFLNLFFGARLVGKDFSTLNNRQLSDIHGGIVFGRVL